MASRKKKLAKDPTTQKHLFGRVRIDNVPQRTRDRVADKTQERRDIKALARLEKERDKLEPGSAQWRRADQAIQRFRNSKGL